MVRSWWRGEIALLYGVIVLIGFIALWALARGGFGRALAAIREDEISARSLGIPVFRRKMQTLAISAALAGVAGSLYAHQASYLGGSALNRITFLFWSTWDF